MAAKKVLLYFLYSCSFQRALVKQVLNLQRFFLCPESKAKSITSKKENFEFEEGKGLVFTHTPPHISITK